MHDSFGDHVAKNMVALNGLVAKIERQDQTNVEEEKAVFTQVEQFLAGLI